MRIIKTVFFHGVPDSCLLRKKGKFFNTLTCPCIERQILCLLIPVSVVIVEVIV
jgi:hypothetical protein